MKKIVLDAGHGGKDSGAVGNELKEKDINLKLVNYVKEYLNKTYTGHEIKLTRSTDVFIELSERANIANIFDADVFLSCHVNAGGGTGFESFVYSSPSKASMSLQNIVNAESLAVAKKYGLGAHGNDKKRGNLAVCRQTKMPAILTEICFIDSKDANLLKKDAFLRDMSESYAKGIAKFLGLKEKPKPKPNPTGTKTSKTKTNGKLYRVQVGAFADKKNADSLAAELKKKGYAAIVTE